MEYIKGFLYHTKFLSVVAVCALLLLIDARFTLVQIVLFVFLSFPVIICTSQIRDIFASWITRGKPIFFRDAWSDEAMKDRYWAFVGFASERPSDIKRRRWIFWSLVCGSGVFALVVFALMYRYIL